MHLVIGAEIYDESGDTPILLGELVPVAFSNNSVCDASGQYGSPTSSTSIQNPFSDYGSQTGSLSPFNLTPLTPPVVKLGEEVLGTLTISPFFTDAIDPYDVLEELGCS